MANLSRSSQSQAGLMSRRWLRCLLGLALALNTIFVGPKLALASGDKATDLASAGLQALRASAPSRALEQFELAGDRGLIDPNLSYNRALAYLLRAKSPQAVPGDLGQVAAGLEEALLLNPDDVESEQVLDAVRAELARVRAKPQGEAVSARPSLGRALVGLAPRAVWDWLAVSASLLLSAGLLGRALLKRAELLLASGLGIGIGLGLLALAAPLSFAAGWLNERTEPAVVITAEAHWLDAVGVPARALPASAHGAGIPEGALVYIHQKAGNLAEVEWGATLGWVSAGQLRGLRQR